MRGIYLDLPLNLGSLWLEVWPCWAGYSHERSAEGGRVTHLGRLHSIWSPAAARASHS